jgi:lactobin A/cerein 7B family class IIb bacteriocin
MTTESTTMSNFNTVFSAPTQLTDDELAGVGGGLFPIVVAGVVITPKVAAFAGAAFVYGIAAGVKWVMCD